MELKGKDAMPLTSRGRNAAKDIETRRKRMRCCAAIAILSVVAAGMVIALVLILTKSTSVDAFAEAVKREAIEAHLTSLMEIASDHLNPSGVPSRAVQYGYNASAEYVFSKLEEAGYENVVRQHFSIPIWTNLATPGLTQLFAGDKKLDFIPGKDFTNLRYGGSGSYNFTAPAVTAGLGCEAADFVNVTGKIVVIEALTSGDPCLIVEKAINAEDAGAAASLIYREGSLITSRAWWSNWTDDKPTPVKPVFGISSTLGTLFGDDDATLNLAMETEIKMEDTYNVCTETVTGRADRTVVFGSHLDSVPEGPGMNDNGSGSSTNLELATQLLKEGVDVVNKVRFCWWGAEEVGLLGSYHYVNNLTPEAHANISLNINMDMLASPNYVRYVHNATTAPEAVRASSTVLQDMLTDAFEAQDLTWALTPMTGGSDYLPFVLAGIPANGVAAGAGSLKTMEERAEFGGMAGGCALDPCYHQPCDTVENISGEALSEFSGTVARVLYQLATAEDLDAILDGGSAAGSS